MFGRLLLIVTETTLVGLETASEQILRLKNYPDTLWRMTKGMAWTTAWIDLVEKLIRAVSGYLENVRTYVSYKTYYARVTAPLSAAYRQMKGKPWAT